MIAWLLLSACTPNVSDKPPVSDDSPGDTAAPPVDLPPNVAEVEGDCGGTFVEPPEYPNQLLPGEDLHKLVLDDPTAVCNDGTPAVLYVRTATGADHANDWILHLQGGSECATAEECEARWCGVDYYDASKMSSAWTPETINGPGINGQDERNLFRTWNQVYFYYCSSDNWQGQSAAPLQTATGTSFTVERRGHQIVAAALAALSSGASSTDGTQVLPSLSAAATVWFTGTSAGSIGAQANLDWVREQLPTSINVLGVFDAAVAPDPSTLPQTVSDAVDAGLAARYASRLAAELEPPFGDASCLAEVPADEDWKCLSSSRLPYSYVTTPFLARMDQEDTPTGDIYVGYGATYDDFMAAVQGSMVALEPRASVFSPRCGEHLGLETEATFLYEPIVGPSGPVSLHDAMQAFLAGFDVELVDPDGTWSVCAQTQ